ncbi:MAG: sulfite exporter TauE/SafE family protein [Bacteroidales bacterium]|nr:sulfite exporter TauE/SafE family protein [Bacteroidales bacterium]MBN2818711.1 sulfite exporter TauE/SafE family protein [Bacteroidales bacterium]
MMEQSIPFLIGTAASLGFIHTVSGPDHYLPFVAMAKVRKWSDMRTAWVVSLCGIGHVLSSVLIGFIGIAAGIAIGKIEFFEDVRGSLASWLLFTVGLIYTVWAIIHRLRNPHHTHSHADSKTSAKKTMTFWVLFTIFVFGPCEPLIPILMYPAADHNMMAVVLIATIFSVTTISTMLIMTFLILKGIKVMSFEKLHHYQHILAGATLTICGAGIIFLGL